LQFSLHAASPETSGYTLVMGELRNLYTSPSVVTVMSMAGGAHGTDEKCVRGFGRETRRDNIPPGIRRLRWEDNIKMDLKGVGCGFDSSGSGWGPVASSCEHGNEPSGSIKGGEVPYYLNIY